jgi:hypothetical protein
MEKITGLSLHCGFFIIVLDLRLTKIGLGSSREFPFSFYRLSYPTLLVIASGFALAMTKLYFTLIYFLNPHVFWLISDPASPHFEKKGKKNGTHFKTEGPISIRLMKFMRSTKF